uniref:Enoyl reductase (ER) domain-containing protein n=2 Tax=Chrysotila carterae TaxID=13221 RepID=A0A7S4ERJ1_CHRCT
MDIPSSVTTTQAAAVPETWLTAYQLLFLVGKATAGDSVLIHAGASGVGIAATQIAVRHGLRVFGTCSENKIKGCRGRGMLDAFDYRAEGGFAPSLLSATGGRGVDVILDCVGAAHAEQSGKVLAQDGRWVLYGLMGGAKLPAGSTLLASLLSKRASLLTSTLRSRDVAYKAELTRQFAQNELPHFASGEYKVVTDSTFPLEQAQEAHERVESNLTEGKVVIRVRS